MIRRLGIFFAGLLALLSTNLSAFTIDTTSRTEVSTAYGTIYAPAHTVPSSWAGNVANCNAGTTTLVHQKATITTANFYRALAGLPSTYVISDSAAASGSGSDPAVVNNATVVNRARQAALYMVANTTLTHSPTSGTCYNANVSAGASTSNLTLGYPSSAVTGPAAIDLYIDEDNTPENFNTMGHRRWVLYTRQIGFATSDIVSTVGYSANALRVFAASDEQSSLFSNSAAGKAWVAWPSPNFVPYSLIPSSGIWTISYPGANFGAATVTITTSGGVNVPVTSVAALPTGYGDNTLRFVPNGLPAFVAGMNDTSYKIQVSNASGASLTTYCYTVTVFDPANSAGGGPTAPDLCASTGKTSQTITFTSTPPSPATIGGTYTVAATGGGSTNAVTFTAAGACSITTPPATVTFNAAGTCTISANQAGNAAYDPAPQVQQTISVGKLDQTISLPAGLPATATFGDTYVMNATASSNLTVAFSIATTSASVCSITGSTVKFNAVGVCTINMNQAGNANYNAAPPVQYTITVVQAGQSITFTSTPPTNATVGDTYVVNAKASSNLAVALTIDPSSTSVCSISSSTVTFNTAGVCTINANQAGNTNYSAALQVQQPITVNKKSQLIAFGPQTTPNRTFVANGTFLLSPTASTSSGLAIAYSSLTTGVCSIVGTLVTMSAVGTCTIAADQAGNGTYAPATQVRQSIGIGVASQTITFTSTPPTNATVTDTYTVNATGGLSGNPVTFTTTGVCSITTPPATVTFNAAGVCTINANQAGNTNYGAATQVSQNITVSKKNQTITFGAQTPSSHPTFTTGDTFLLNPVASASSGLTVTYSSLTGACSIVGTMVTIATAGTCTIAADQSGNGTYAPAMQVRQNIAIGLASQTITFTSAPPTHPTVGGAYKPSATGGLSGSPVTFSIDPASTTGACTISAGPPVTVMFTGEGTCILDANQAAGAGFAAATSVQQFIIIGPPGPGPGPLSITTPVPALDSRALWLLAVLVGLLGMVPIRAIRRN
ncbi:MAG: hypothetical protein FWC42_00310 [Proteobacteria bacterium]|nr:hypothetical protein [Pseudomonadota bacterium]